MSSRRLIAISPPARLIAKPRPIDPDCDAPDESVAIDDVMPMTQSEFHHAKPIYELVDGWSEDISKARTFDELPPNCQAYVRRLEELIGCRISGIGVGPGREQVVMLHGLL